MNGLVRESKNRSRSERIIDRQVGKDDILVTPTKKIKVEEEKAEVSCISSSEAFEKIKRCLGNVKRVSKTVPVLRSFLKKYFNRVGFDAVLDCIQKVFSYEIEKVFPITGLFELLNDIEKFYPDIIPSESLYLKASQEIAATFNQIFTDDSLEFHKILKKIESTLDTLQPSSELTTLYGKSLKCLIPFATKPWSRVSVQKFFQSLYMKREIFSQPVQETIIQVLDCRSTSKTTEEIRSIDEAKHVVEDTRVHVFTIDGQDSWASKQSGLNEKSNIY